MDPYIEVFHLGPDGGDLQGVEITCGDASAQLTGSVSVDNGALVLFARLGTSPCYGSPGHPLGIELAGAGRPLRLATPSGTTLDTVDLTGWTIPEGASVQLSPGAMSAAENGLQASWSLSTAAIGASGDLGTPGAPNTGC